MAYGRTDLTLFGPACSACRREMRAAAVAQAEVVACTLSAAGGDLPTLLPPGVGFDALICDEAAQASLSS